MATEVKDKLINAEAFKAMHEYNKLAYATKQEMKESTKKDDCFSESTRKLLVDILKNAVYSSDMTEIIQSLSVALGGNIMYTIKSNFKNVTNDNTLLEIADGEKYVGNITVKENCKLKTMTITMGGVDITEEAYKDGSILIEQVTGNIKITASAVDSTMIPITLKQGAIQALYPYIDESVESRVSYVGNEIKLTAGSTYEIIGQENVLYTVNQILTTGVEAYYSNATLPYSAKKDSGWVSTGYTFTAEEDVFFAFFTAKYDTGNITPVQAMPLYIREV